MRRRRCDFPPTPYIAPDVISGAGRRGFVRTNFKHHLLPTANSIVPPEAVVFLSGPDDWCFGNALCLKSTPGTAASLGFRGRFPASISPCAMHLSWRHFRRWTGGCRHGGFRRLLSSDRQFYRSGDTVGVFSAPNGWRFWDAICSEP